MQSSAKTPEEYLKEIPTDRFIYFSKLRDTIKKNIPKGYHCKPSDPLPFVGIASQKNFIALYHMGIYANPDLLKWFVAEYPKHSPKKLDMGKSCIRFKKADEIPYELIAELMKKMTVNDWIHLYEKSFINKI